MAKISENQAMIVKVVAPSSVMSHMLVQIHCPNRKERVCNMSRVLALGRKLRLRGRALVSGGTELTGHPLVGIAYPQQYTLHHLI